MSNELEKDIESLNAEISNLKKENLKKEMLLQSKISTIKCGMCSQTFNSENQFKVHMEKTKCQVCDKSAEIIEELKDDIKVLRGTGKGLMDEKKKHKVLCDLSKGCLHQGTCPDNCCYTAKVLNLPESNFEETDDENVKLYSQDKEKVSKKNPNLKCKECEFVAKSTAGLSKHNKKDHDIQCEKCDLSTTTKILLNYHIKENHK